MMIAVYGGGSWGTALAHVWASAGRETRLVLRDGSVAAAINERQENPHYLPGLKLSPELRAETKLELLGEADVWILALPCQTQRRALEGIRRYFSPDKLVVNTAKGLELESLKRLSTVARETLGQGLGYAALSGPSFAREVVEGRPTAVALACEDENRGQAARALLSTPLFRCYSSRDLCGVELGGAVKNVIAIAAGVCDGLELGHNARAALVTRGLAETCRLGLALGAEPTTFMGLSGLGDLLLTCTGDLSRNRQVGLQLGRNTGLESILEHLGGVSEGVKTARALRDLARKLAVEMPITEAVNDLLDGQPPREAVERLMNRALRAEMVVR